MIRKINSEACLRFKMFMLKHKILRVFLFSFFYSSTPQKGKKSGEKKSFARNRFKNLTKMSCDISRIAEHGYLKRKGYFKRFSVMDY